MRDNCDKCEKPSTSYRLSGNLWICRHCLDDISGPSCRLFEYGHENPQDPKGSTAHVRDIKDRRYHKGENRTFYYSKEMGKKYFFPK